MNRLSFFIIPTIVLSITIYGFIKKVNLYDSFIKGAKEGLNITLNIFPFVIGMVFAINILLRSNFIPFIFSFASNFFSKINVPVDILPMTFLRSISGNATLVILNDIFKKFGPDSFAGRLASTIQGSSDTTFYVITLYFGSVGVTKIKHSLKAGLFSDFMGIIMSFVIVYLIFG